MEARKQWDDIFKVLKEKQKNPSTENSLSGKTLSEIKEKSRYSQTKAEGFHYH